MTKPDTTTLTVNQRLARSLRMAHDAAQMASGREVWESADILPVGAWVQRCWNTLLDSGDEPLPVLLSRPQESVLWETCIREHLRHEPAERQLLQIGAAARRAGTANEQLRAWRVALDDIAFDLNEDTRVFAAWSRLFERHCAEHGFIDSARATEHIVERIRGGRLTTPAQVVMAGFGELDPRQVALLDALRDRGVAVTRLESTRGQAAGVRVGFADAPAELEAAARFARAVLEDGGAGPIGIVVPDLERRRAEVERVFDDILRPGALSAPCADGRRPFNISLGVPFTEFLVVRHALLGLMLNDTPMEFAALSELLRSPYLGLAEQELCQRGRLDAALRTDGELELSLRRLIRVVDRGPQRGWGTHFNTPGLQSCLNALLELTRAQPRRQRLGAWSGVFAACLNTLGWPGERALDSSTYQAIERFHALLGELATLDVMSGELSYADALARLRRLAAESVFQPRSEPAPVQILGVLESEGLEFSHLWVCGLEDQRWPQAPRPNPFIPLTLQRKLGMPHASAEWELAAARRATGMWLHSADMVVMSYPLNEGDEALRASPLLEELLEVTAEDLPRSHVCTYADQLRRSDTQREALVDDTGPAVVNGASTRGGTRLFKDQAACPFRAFVTHRLGAGALDEPAPGLDARARGNVVHRLLELLWLELKSQARLNELGEDDLDAVLETVVVQALKEQARTASSTLSGRFFELERVRLKALANAWLDEERRRPVFEVVAPEHQQVAHIGGLPVRIRPDRVDRLADGRYLLIDYKTGKVRVDDWFDERIEEPQLPIYCSALDGDGDQLDLFEPKAVGGVAFGVVKRDQVGYKGVAEETGIACGIRALEEIKSAAEEFQSWSELKRAWRARLNALADEFLRGDARVAPKDVNRTCAYCDIRPVCRINEILKGAGKSVGGSDLDA